MDRKTLTPAEEKFLNFRFEGEEIPRPPYQLGDVQMLFVGVRFREGVARRVLPRELEPAGSEVGLLCAYTVGSGWGVAPYSSLFAAVEVKGVNAPDGSSGYCIVAGWYSGGGHSFMHRYYNLLPEEGGARLYREGDVLVGVGGPPGVDAVMLRARTTKTALFGSAVHHYLGQHPQGGASLFAIAFSGVAMNAEPISVDFGEAAGARMGLLRPVELTYALECSDAALTFGMPQLVGGSLDLAGAGAQVTVLDAFSRIGRAAILVSADGAISAMTPRAGLLLGDGIVAHAGGVRATYAADQVALDRLIQFATAGGVNAEQLTPIALRRQGGQSLIVEALPAGSAATGRISALLLLNDPARPATGNSAAALQLLGLTPAESRVAELVGSGKSPREAADELELTLNTVRSALKIAFDKLGISRQSELARIVARLAG